MTLLCLSLCLSFACCNQLTYPADVFLSTCSEAEMKSVFACVLCPAGCDHRGPGRWHGDHPRVRPHLAAAWAAPSADPDCALHGKSCNLNTQRNRHTRCCWAQGNISSIPGLFFYQAINSPVVPHGWMWQEITPFRFNFGLCGVHFYGALLFFECQAVNSIFG